MAEDLLRRLIAAGVIYPDGLTVTDAEGYKGIAITTVEAAYLLALAGGDRG